MTERGQDVADFSQNLTISDKYYQLESFKSKGLHTNSGGKLDKHWFLKSSRKSYCPNGSLALIGFSQCLEWSVVKLICKWTGKPCIDKWLLLGSEKFYRQWISQQTWQSSHNTWRDLMSNGFTWDTGEFHVDDNLHQCIGLWADSGFSNAFKIQVRHS